KANLFHYYPTKEALGLAVFDYSSDGFKEWIMQQLQTDTKDPMKKVVQMFDTSIASMRDNNCRLGCFVGNLAQELSNHNESIRIKISDLFKHWIDELATLLEHEQATGYLRADFNPKSAAEAIIALFEGSLLIAKARKSPETIENAKQMAIDYISAFKS
ncbi:MAG: TetR family transcriptional regulator C-terminal domain-containing protein, partial [Acidobacteriota bacterium]